MLYKWNAIKVYSWIKKKLLAENEGEKLTKTDTVVLIVEIFIFFINFGLIISRFGQRITFLFDFSVSYIKNN